MIGFPSFQVVADGRVDVRMYQVAICGLASQHPDIDPDDERLLSLFEICELFIQRLNRIFLGGGMRS